MRASKTVGSKEQKKIHISGAEGIYEESEISKISNSYIKRALNHSRGMPDKIVITIEEIKQEPEKISLLPVTALKCSSPDEAKKIIIRTLTGLGISKGVINNGLEILESKKTMRGASLMLIESGRRAEPDMERGVRVSRMGIEKSTEKKLSQMLCKIVIPAKAGIQSKETGFRVKPGMTGTCNKIIKNNTSTVKEALILASKAASCPYVIAEVCISDDPDYTTGYIASKELGYLRIPNIKNYGEMNGGRVFFIREDANIDMLINYLERKPAILC